MLRPAWGGGGVAGRMVVEGGQLMYLGDIYFLQ